MNLKGGSVLNNRYTLLTRVEDHGLGEAWRALDAAQSQREVTLKLLRPGSAGAVAACGAAARVNAPTLLRPLDAGVVGDRAFVAYDRFAGRSLGAWIDDARAKRELPSLAWIRAVFDAVALATEALHAAGVAHGALSLATVLVSAGDPTVRVIDAGLAPFAADEAEKRGARGVDCAAPEVIAGEPASAASDVYSLGLVLLEALAQPPEMGRSTSMGLRYEGRTDVVDAVWDAVILATKPKAAERFQSVTALRAALAEEWEGFDALESPTVMTPSPAGSTVAIAPAAPARARHSGTSLAEDVGMDGGGARGAAFAGTMVADLDQRLARMQSLSSALLAHDFVRNLPSAASTPSLPPPPPPPRPAPTSSLAPAAPRPDDDRGRAVMIAAIVIVALAGVAMIAWALLRGGRA
jgi:serine/threonine protein kinase